MSHRYADNRGKPNWAVLLGMVAVLLIGAFLLAPSLKQATNPPPAAQAAAIPSLDSATPKESSAPAKPVPKMVSPVTGKPTSH